jgi:hypothetical protein
MSVLTRSPQNTNYLQASKFLLSFSRITEVQYFCQEVNLPGVSLSQAQYTTPLVDIPIGGNKLSYNPLNIQFTVNESVSDWIQLYNWFRSFGDPSSTDNRRQMLMQQGGKYYSDATLTVLSALNNPIIKVNFYNVFPLSLSDIQFSTMESADNIISGQASFMYNYYEFASV